MDIVEVKDTTREGIRPECWCARDLFEGYWAVANPAVVVRDKIDDVSVGPSVDEVSW